MVLVMIQIGFEYLIRDVAYTPATIPDTPKMPTPVTSLQFTKLLQKQLGAPPLEPLDQIADTQRRGVRQVQMDVVLTDDALQNMHIQGVTGLAQQVPAPYLYIPRQHLVTVFCTPHQMHLQVVDRMSAGALLHDPKLFKMSSN